MGLPKAKSLIPKSITSMRGYSLSSFWGDLGGGLTVGVVAFPLAMAFAIGAGLSPERGLFTAIVAGLVVSLFGGCRVQIAGPAGSFIVVLYDILLRHGFNSLVIATLLAGLFLIFFGLAGLGTYIKYIPYPVVTALLTGIAVVIASSQIKDFLGLEMGEVPVNFIEKWKAYGLSVTTWDPTTFGVGLGTLSLIIFFRRLRPQIPGTILALALAALINWLFDLQVPTIGSKYGTLPHSLPSPHLPSFSFATILELTPDALTIALLAGIDSLLSAVVTEGMTGWRHQSNLELVAQGCANIGSVLFGGIPASGSMARSAIALRSGAKTPISGIIHSLTVFAILYLLAPLVGTIPLAALAAVLLMIAWNMSEIHHFIHLFAAPFRDIVVLLTVFILTILVNMTVAVQVGMILAAFLFMKQMSDVSGVVSTAPYVEEEGEKREEIRDPEAISKKNVPEGAEVYEINGPFFFGVADRLKNLLNELERPPPVFILRMRKVPTIDASGMHALEEFFLECKRQGTLLLLSGVKKSPLQDLRRYHLDELIGKKHIFSEINGALEFAKEFLRTDKRS